ncbi:MAG: SNF2-related protein, partial [Pseudonocardia sp.]|nr:SNF2-related protein [Pseudonocardia sp.]
MSVGMVSDLPTAAAALERYGPLLAQLAGSVAVDERRSALVDEAGEVWSRPGFDTVLSEPRLRFTPFDYQLATMQTVLRRMRGRAILADEVGLGKTIEAGLVLSELRMRGLADRALVITPAGLVGQWGEELERKFALPTAVAARGTWDTGTDRPVVLASLAAARRDPLRSARASEQGDVVIVAEAPR